MMQLALDMGATLQELNNRMSAKEFALWSALHQSQPRGVERDNFHAAIVATVIANSNAPKGKTFKVNDFIHEDHEIKKEREQQAFFARMRSLSTPKVIK